MANVRAFTTAALLLVTTAQASANAEWERMINAMVGRTLADFTRETGLTPHDAVDSPAGRTFFLRGHTVYLSAPAYGLAAPGVVADRTCQVVIETEMADRRGYAESWRILSISSRGYC